MCKNGILFHGGAILEKLIWRTTDCDNQSDLYAQLNQVPFALTPYH